MIETDEHIPIEAWKKYLASVRQLLKAYKQNPDLPNQVNYLSKAIDFTVNWCKDNKAEELFAACKLRADAFFAMARCQAGEITTETFARIIKNMDTKDADAKA